MIKLRIRGKWWFLQDESERHSKTSPSREDALQRVSLNSGLPAQARVVGHLLGDELSLALGDPQRQLPVPPLLLQNSLPSGLFLTLRLQLQLHLHLHTHRTHTHALVQSQHTWRISAAVNICSRLEVLLQPAFSSLSVRSHFVNHLLVRTCLPASLRHGWRAMLHQRRKVQLLMRANAFSCKTSEKLQQHTKRLIATFTWWGDGTLRDQDRCHLMSQCGDVRWLDRME